MFKGLSIRNKLLAGFFILALVVVLTGGLSIRNTQKTSQVFTRIIETDAPRLQALLEIKSAIRLIRTITLTFQGLEAVTSQKEGTKTAQKKFELLAALEELRNWREEYQNLSQLQGEDKTAFIQNLKEKEETIISLSLGIITLQEKGKRGAELLGLADKLEAVQDELEKTLQSEVNAEFAGLQETQHLAQENNKRAIRNNLILSMGVVFSALLVGIFLWRVIARPLFTFQKAAQAIAQGNLNQKIVVSSHDELGELALVFNSMAQALKSSHENLEEKVREKTQELRKAIEQVAQFGAVADKDRALYLLLLSSIGEGVLVLDLDRKVTTTNKAAEGILGYAKEELVGKRFDAVLKFIHRKDKTPLENSFWEGAYQEKKSRVLPHDISVITKSGAAIPIADVVAPIIDPRTKELSGLIVTFRDVREERALEEARLSFISTASHQLRTPLTSMRWFLEMLTDGDAGAITKAQATFVDRVYQGTGRMISLINLLLQIARVEAGRVKVEPVPIDFKNFLHEIMLALNLPNGKSQRVKITAVPDPFPQILMDKEVIWQVFQNLLSNANRYSPKKSVIQVSMAKKGDAAEFAVKDKGIGIPKDQQGRIFEKFFRADNALKLAPEGSGLGLSLVKALVEGWGGKIWFESEEGRGTAFYFTVPLAGMKPKGGEVTLSV